MKYAYIIFGALVLGMLIYLVSRETKKAKAEKPANGTTGTTTGTTTTTGGAMPPAPSTTTTTVVGAAA